MDHGVDISEVATGVVPPVSVTAGLPVYVGTAPINLGDTTAVNRPVLASALSDAEAALGQLQTDFNSWTLHEAITAHFIDYKVGPVVFINVIDPARHFRSIVGEAHTLDLTTGSATMIHFGVILSTVAVKVGGFAKNLTTDYTLAFDDNGMLVVTRVPTGTIAAGANITVDYHYLDPTMVTAADIIGGYTAGQFTGIQAIEAVYPLLRLVPGLLLAPRWSKEPSIAAALTAEAHAIDGSFRAVAVVDISAEPYDTASYSDAITWKSNNGYDALDQVVCWPNMRNGANVYHGSTVFACVANVTDAANNGQPFVSPSNKAVVGDAAVLDDGTEVLLTRPQANLLNGNGIVTFLNGFSGWKLWGNRTAIYPGSTDPKDAFIPLRRMFSWMENTVILTTDDQVDQPGNLREIDGIVGTIKSFLNGLVAAGALIKGTIEFRKDENPTTDLADGKIRFHLTLTPPSPAEQIEFITEYDPAALAALFGS